MMFRVLRDSYCLFHIFHLADHISSIVHKYTKIAHTFFFLLQIFVAQLFNCGFVRSPSLVYRLHSAKHSVQNLFASHSQTKLSGLKSKVAKYVKYIGDWVVGWLFGIVVHTLIDGKIERRTELKWQTKKAITLNWSETNTRSVYLAICTMQTFHDDAVCFLVVYTWGGVLKKRLGNGKG